MTLSKKRGYSSSTSNTPVVSTSPGTTAASISARRKVVIVPKKEADTPVKSGPKALSKITGEWNSASNQYMIREVVIGGRTPSPFGSTMGAHSTAWVAHVDLIRRHLVGVDLQSALRSFIKLINSELSSPLLQLKEHLVDAHKTKLEKAATSLRADGTTLTADSNKALTQATYNAVLQHLRSAINTYLTYVNYLPLATVAGGDPAGHGEGAARGELNLFEAAASIKHKTHGTIQNNQSLETLKAVPTDELKVGDDELIGLDATLKKLLTNKLKANELTNYKAYIRATLWQMFAAETPMIFLESSAATTHSRAELWAFAIQNFLRTIRLAYPYAYSFSEMSTPSLLKKDLASNDLADYFREDADKVIALVTGKKTFHGAFALSVDDQLKQSVPAYQAIGLSDYTQGGTELQTTVLLTDDEKIGDIHFQGRTKSPFSGTMGAHSTAWVVHLDALTRELVGKSLPSAYDELQHLATEAFESDLLDYTGIVNEKQQVALMRGYDSLNSLLGETNFDDFDTGTQHAKIEQLIVAYLNFINVIPLSTVEIGGVPGGRSEGQHRQFLQAYEEHGKGVFTNPRRYNAKKIAGILDDHLIGLYDHKGIVAFEPEFYSDPNDISEWCTYDDEHFLSPKLDQFDHEANEKEEYALQNFVNIIAKAYPKSYADSTLLARIEKKFRVTVEEPADYYKAKGIQKKKRKKISAGWTKKLAPDVEMSTD